jgi:DNA repair photolyase
MLRRLELHNPKSRFSEREIEYDEGEVPEQGLVVLEDDSRSILSENSSPDLPFRFSLNAYRGCAHGCSYCYARPSHEYLGFGAGTDFERRIVFKPHAAVLLRERFEHQSWRGELIAISGNTDAYQPLESKLRLTRKCLEVCAEYKNPVHIITKSALVERDIDIFERLRDEASIGVSVSVTSFDAEVSRLIEPYAPPPSRRIEIIRRLSERKIPVLVHIAPWIPGLTDRDIVPILEATRDAGAISAMAQPVRLPGATEQVFVERLERDFPLQAPKVLARIRDLRSGKLNDTRFHSRMKGEGSYAETITSVFRATCIRLGFAPFPHAREGTFARPRSGQEQLSLFAHHT